MIFTKEQLLTTLPTHTIKITGGEVTVRMLSADDVENWESYILSVGKGETTKRLRHKLISMALVEPKLTEAEAGKLSGVIATELYDAICKLNLLRDQDVQDAQDAQDAKKNSVKTNDSNVIG